MLLVDVVLVVVRLGSNVVLDVLVVELVVVVLLVDVVEDVDVVDVVEVDVVEDVVEVVGGVQELFSVTDPSNPILIVLV